MGCLKLPNIEENTPLKVSYRSEGLGSKSSTGQLRFGYQGLYSEEDEETGFNHFEARLYDSKIWRWNSMDPAGQFYSPYNGMGNNPVNRVDPDGRYSRFGAWWRKSLMPAHTNPYTYEIWEGEWALGWSDWQNGSDGQKTLKHHSITQGGPGPGVGFRPYAKAELAGRAGILNYGDRGENVFGYKYDLGSVDFVNLELGYDRLKSKNGFYNFNSDILSAGKVNFSAQVETVSWGEFDIERNYNPFTGELEGKSMIGISMFRAGRIHSNVHGNRTVFGFGYDQSNSTSYSNNGTLGTGWELEFFGGIEMYQIQTR